MRVHIRDADGRDILDVSQRLEESSGLSYETAMPGGMTIATLLLPWERGLSVAGIIGSRLLVDADGDTVWWGRVTGAADVAQHGARSLRLTAHAPWERSARRAWQQVYPINTGGWAAEDIIKAAVFGNVEDVLISDQDWTDPNMDICPITWSGSTVQTCIADALRLGDTGTTPWSFLIWPPRTRAATGGFTFSSTCELMTDFSGTTMAGAGSVSAQAGLYMRGSKSMQCYANNAAGTASAYYALAGTADDLWMSAWVFFRKESATGVEHDWMTFYDTGLAVIATLRTNGTDTLYLYNNVTGASYTPGVVLARGCWHHLEMRLVRHRTAPGSGNGIVELWLDDKRISNNVSLDTGANSIKRMAWGMIRTAVGDRYQNYDNVIIHTSRVGMAKTNLVAETLPACRIIQLSTSDYDTIISLDEIGQSYTIERNMVDSSNQVDMAYGSTPTDLAMAIDTDSVAQHGQYQTQITAAKTGSATVAAYLRARWLAQFADPVPSLQPITLTAAPQSKAGTPYPLCRLRAGVRFRIRELPELGNLYIGHTRYQRGEPGQPEQCQITPYGTVARLDALLAGKVGKRWD